MKKFIHIGFPKCLSTSLQRCFFSKHPEINYYGVGIKNNIDYINDDISNLIEVFIRYASKSVFDENKEKLKTIVNKKLKESKKKGFRAAGISAEIMSIGYSAFDNDRYEKARRLKYIFGKNAKIIILIRNQYDFLKSIYRESIRLGYKRTFKEFVNFHYKFNCKSLISDIRYDDIVLIYRKLFSSKNVFVIPYESVITKNKKLIKDRDKYNLISKNLNKILNLSYFNPIIKNLNKSLDDYVLYQKMVLNKTNSHELANDQFDLIESHRIINYFKKKKVPHLKKDPYNDIKIKRKLIKKSIDLAKTSRRKINFKIDPKISLKLKNYFMVSNKKLKKILKVNLKKYGY